jgi:FtsZ-binding cell division protein ZapB
MGDPSMIERKARIFRFGHYPTKRWGITREQFVAANGESGVIPIGIDPIGKAHYVGLNSAFDGRTGRARWEVVGDEIMATLEMPALVHDAATEHGLKLSTVWPAPSYDRLTQVDFVKNPQVKDAVMLAEGDEPLLIEGGAEPEAVALCSDEEAAMFAQEVHDLAGHNHPSLCDPAVKHKGATEADHHVRMIHDHAVLAGGAYCPGMHPDHRDPEESLTMSGEDRDIDELLEENERLQAEVESLKSRKAVALSAEHQETPREKALREEVEQIRAERINDQAITFAEQVASGEGAVALPAEKPWIISQFKANATLDRLAPAAITFSDGSETREGTHLDAFKASFKLRPAVKGKAPLANAVTLSAEPPTGGKSGDDELDEIDKETRAWASGVYGKRN